MTMEDLGQALGNQGVTVKKPPYYTWIKCPFVEEYPPVSLFSEIVTTVLAAETIEKSKKIIKGNPVPALTFKSLLYMWSSQVSYNIFTLLLGKQRTS